MFPTETLDRTRARALVIAWVKSQVDKHNDELRERFIKQAQEWEFNAKRAQEIEAEIPPKPAPPFGLEIVPFDNSHDDSLLPIDVRVSNTPIAPPVDDLPPLPPKPSGIVVKMGVKLYGNWYQAMAGDTAPDGHEHVQADGKYQKVMSPFGGWWLKVS